MSVLLQFVSLLKIREKEQLQEEKLKLEIPKLKDDEYDMPQTEDNVNNWA